MDYISVSEAARMLGISRQRVLVLIKVGRIPAQRLDGSTVYTIKRTDLFRFIRTRRQPITLKRGNPRRES